MDVLSDQVSPQECMPFALTGTPESIREQHSDLPGHPETEDGDLFGYGYGYGLRY